MPTATILVGAEGMVLGVEHVVARDAVRARADQADGLGELVAVELHLDHHADVVHEAGEYLVC